MKEITLGLCRGRHEMPVSEYIFDADITNPHDYTGMYHHACMVIKAAADAAGSEVCYDAGVPAFMTDSLDVTCGSRREKLVIYATGLTAALLSAINAGYSLWFNHIETRHYDRETGEYRSQAMFRPV